MLSQKNQNLPFWKESIRDDSEGGYNLKILKLKRNGN